MINIYPFKGRLNKLRLRKFIISVGDENLLTVFKRFGLDNHYLLDLDTKSLLAS